jgi:NitT/TauT family transport system substrate-binding protein
MPSRSTFLTAASAVAAFPRALDAQALTTVRVGGTPEQSIVGTLWAMQSGLFARDGLNVQLTTLNSGGAVTSALLGGSLDVGKTNLLGVISAHAKGIPLLLVAPALIYSAQDPDMMMMLVAKNGPIHDARDLDGKTVAVPALSDVFTVACKAWIDTNGGGSTSVHFLELPHRAAAEAVTAGRVDAAMVADPLLGQALASGNYRVFAHPMDAIAKRFIADAYFCTADYVEKNADVVARFRRAVLAGYAYAGTHRAEMVPLIAKFTGVDESAVTPTGTYATLADLEDTRIIQPLIDAAVKYQQIPQSFPAKDLLDPALVH